MRQKSNVFKNIIQRLSIVLIALLVGGFLAEIAVRNIGHIDDDGQFYFQDRAIRPYVLPVKSLTSRLNNYLEFRDSALMIYDELLGWKLRPNYGVDMNSVNADGLRANREYSLTPDDNVLRIAVFGDSFTMGAEVTTIETWAYLLEQNLIANGINVEVLNFGVPGYGMDQAYLMWQLAGKQYSPDIVIFGFQPENIHRNVNIFRPVYSAHSMFPFSKPRFVLDGNKLSLKNSPTIPVNDLITTYENLQSHPLAKYESYYDQFNVEYWWMQSKFLAVLFDLLNTEEGMAALITADGERVQLATAIIDAFAQEVQASDAQFFIAHLHNKGSMKRYVENQVLLYHVILDTLSGQYSILSFEDAFGEWNDDYWALAGHYSALGNEIVAKQIALDIEKCLTDGSCQLTRMVNYRGN